MEKLACKSCGTEIAGWGEYLINSWQDGRWFLWESFVFVFYVLSRVQLFSTPRTVARQAPLSMGILQARILECVAIPSSRGSSQPRDETQVSRIAGGFFSLLSHQRSPRILQWVAYPFSSGTSWPRSRTGVSCIAGV